MDRPRIYVDFNEMVEDDLVLLSKDDTKYDCEGNEIQLFAGKIVDIYMNDIDAQGYTDNLIASGTVELNYSKLFSVCKWNCRIDSNGIQHESEEIEKSLHSENVDLVTKKMVYVAFYWDNWKWVQEKCIELLENTNDSIRGLAATCLGHIARIHKTIDKEKVLSILKSKEHDEAIKEQIADAITDIKIFTK